MLDAILELADRFAPITFIAGVCALVYGGNRLVDGAVDIARRLHFSVLLIGLTIVAFGTSAPELAFNVIAAVNDRGDLSFGNVIGSNIANIGLVLGISALFAPLVVNSRIIRREAPWLIIVSAGMLGLVMMPPRVDVSDVVRADEKFQAMIVDGFSRPAGLILIAAFIGSMIAWYRMGRSDRKDALATDLLDAEIDESKPPRPMHIAIAITMVGLALLVLGGKLAEVGAAGLARMLGFSEAMIGLTIVALATSLPELVTSIIAVRRGHSDLAVGNVVGSNLFNILLVLGVTATVAPVPLPPWGWWDLGVMLLLTVLLWPLCFVGRHSAARKQATGTGERPPFRLSLIEGSLLLLIYVGYIAFTIMRERW